MTDATPINNGALRQRAHLRMKNYRLAKILLWLVLFWGGLSFMIIAATESDIPSYQMRIFMGFVYFASLYLSAMAINHLVAPCDYKPDFLDCDVDDLPRPNYWRLLPSALTLAVLYWYLW